MSVNLNSKNKLLNKKELQYALNNFASIVKNVEHFENNWDYISNLPQDIQMLTVTGYYVSLASLIRNSHKNGFDYTKIFKLWEEAIKENHEYLEQNKGLKHNITVLKKWEKSLEYEMKHVLTIRNRYFGHIDFVEENFLLNHFKSKDRIQQYDLSKFFRKMIDVIHDYSLAVLKEYNQTN